MQNRQIVWRYYVPSFETAVTVVGMFTQKYFKHKKNASFFGVKKNYPLVKFFTLQY